MKKKNQKWLALLLAVVMMIGMLPMNVFATTTESSVKNYNNFMAALKVLEGYAAEYAAEIYGKDPGELVLNFIRTGVERYQDDNWNTLAGYENTGFTNYVAEQDAEHSTNAMSLKNIVIDDFTLPNGNPADFGHMFGCMNISYVAPGSADLSGWAGDICDLLQYSVTQLDKIPGYAEGDVEQMAAYIQKNCFGVNASGAYGWDDFYGDMDAYYLIAEYKKAGGTKKFSELMDVYFNGKYILDDNDVLTDIDGDQKLTDIDRAVYFMNNRFAVADSNEAVRKAIWESYSADVGIGILEAKRGLSSYNSLRKACCYAFADYVYSQAKGKLIEGAPSDNGPKNGYYSVFSSEESVLAPGITQEINYAQTADGKQIVYYVATVDVTRDDVDVLVNYNNNKPPVGDNIGAQTVQKQAEALVANYRNKTDENGNPVYENFNAIVAINGAGYSFATGEPAGLVVMQGVEYYPVGAPGFFAILSDGSAVIGDQAKYEELKKAGLVKEAIQAFGSVLVKDGKVCVTKSANYTASRASRTAIGITAEGKVVMMVLDGRQLPRSAGGALEEIAQIMLEAGCVEAVNLDGGGSTTYLSKPAGSDDIQLVNVPSDGYPRSVSTSLVAVSTAAPSTAFDSAIISSDYEYITAGTSMQFRVTGVSNTGNAAVIPEGAYWRVSDENIGTIDKDTGLFTAGDYGTVTVQFVVNGEVEGEKTIQVVIPDNIKFAEDRIVAIYGVPKEIGVTVWYQGYPVAFTPYVDALVLLERRLTEEERKAIAEEDEIDISEVEFYTWDIYSDAGVIDGMTFTGDDSKGVRTANLLAVVATADAEIEKFGTVNLYYADEATFDFENATQGNRSFAWDREIENARTLDNKLYRIADPNSPVVIDYTFALDMTAIDFPPQLEPMKSMLPTFNENSTAWDYLLQLAERVCIQTNVTIRAEFSKELDVDIRELKIINDYFTPTSINLDANNVLTIVCHWVNQSQPIDPATANPLCILTGIKATVKDTAAYINNKVTVINHGTVSYDIYLAASSLYSFACDPANQAKYGIYPYIHEEDCRSDFVTDDPGLEDGDDSGEPDPNPTNNDKGAHFSSQYVDFSDDYIINSEILNGWHEEGSAYYYYVNNEPLTGIQLVPDRHDATQDRFCEFDENGKLTSEQGETGLIEWKDNLYYAILGVAQTGWQQLDGNNYYFHLDTNKAVDGVQTIKEFVYPASSATDPTTATYTYTFTNHVLTRGDLCKGTAGGITGLRYRWAGKWMDHCWFEVDGKTYHVDSHGKINGKSNWGCFVTTGYAPYIADYGKHNWPNDRVVALFDENGVLQENFSGAAYAGASSGYIYFKNGIMYSTPGIAQGDDGYYYYVSDGWNGKVEISKQFEVKDGKGRGFVPNGTYTFDEFGRLTDNLVGAVTTGTNVQAEPTVLGRVMTVRSSQDCWVLCKVGNVYQRVEARVNPYGAVTAAADATSEYNFIIPKGATDVKVFLAGDINMDGVVNAADVTAAVTNQVDINGNGVVNSADKILLALAVLGYKPLTW